MYMSTAARLQMRHREKLIMGYYDHGGPGKGNCTFGIGTLAHHGPCSPDELAKKVTESEVESAFVSRVRDAERAIERNIKVELTQAQFDALVSFTFNRGPRGASAVYKLVNERNFSGAASRISSEIYGHELRRGVKVKVLYRGLIPRRAEESAPFRGTR